MKESIIILVLSILIYRDGGSLEVTTNNGIYFIDRYVESPTYGAICFRPQRLKPCMEIQNPDSIQAVMSAVRGYYDSDMEKLNQNLNSLDSVVKARAKRLENSTH